MALQGKIHHAAVNKPILVRRRGFEGMALRLSGRVPLATRSWYVLIDLAVDGHDPLDRAHGEIGFAPQTPNAKASGIGMTLLQMIDFHHRRQPGLAPRGVRRATLVRQALQVVDLKARNPRGDGGAGDVQKLTDTARTPAWRLEGKHLHAGLGTLGLTVVVEQGKLLGSSGGQLVPELLHAMVTEAARQGMQEDPGQCSGPEAVVEACEPLECFHPLVGHPPPPASREDRERGGEEAEHALRFKASCEGADRFGVGVGFLCPLDGGAILPEPQRAEEFIAMWRRVVERELGVVNIRKLDHR